MSGPNSYSRSALIPVLGLLALGLFALNFHTALSRNWGDWQHHHRTYCRTAVRVHPAPVPPVPPVPLPAIAGPEPQMDLDIDVDMEQLERDLQQMEKELQKMEVEVHVEAMQEAKRALMEAQAEAQRQIVVHTKDAAVAIIR